jgi:hypothetical protein
VRITDRKKERNSSEFYPDYDAPSTLTRPKKQSAAVRPSVAEKVVSGASPDNDTTQHAHAHNKPSRVEKGHSSDCNATQHATKRKREKLPTV